MSEALLRPFSPGAIQSPSCAPGGLQRNLGKDMSTFRFASSRSTIASAALLSLVLLAGCESTTTTEPPSPNSDTAGTSNGTALPGENPISALSAQLASVGDRVRFGLDRYDLTAEAQATLQKQAALLQSYPQVAVTIEGHA